VKVILLHGGKFFSSGNDLSQFFEWMKTEDGMKNAEEGVK